MFQRLIDKFVSAFCCRARFFRRKDSQREKAGGKSPSKKQKEKEEREKKEVADAAREQDIADNAVYEVEGGPWMSTVEKKSTPKKDKTDRKLQEWKAKAQLWTTKTYLQSDFGVPGDLTGCSPNKQFPKEHVIIYTDGSLSYTRQASGIGMFYGNDHPLHGGFSSGARKTPFAVELLAIHVALHRIYCWGGYKGWSIILRSDSLNCISALANLYGEDRKMVKYDLNDFDKTNLKDLQYIVDQFPAEVTFQWVKGHSGDEGNMRADALAVEGREKGDKTGKTVEKVLIGDGTWLAGRHELKIQSKRGKTWTRASKDKRPELKYPSEADGGVGADVDFLRKDAKQLGIDFLAELNEDD